MKQSSVGAQVRCAAARVLCALALGLALPAAAIAATGSAGGFAVDFTDYRAGSVDAWLKAKGFEFKRDAGSPEKIALRADQRGLALEALKPAQGLLVNNLANASAYSHVEIEWGVTQHPEGASYERKVNNEAIMVHVFFGSEKMPSGSMFAPDIPAFIGLFLCNGDRIGHAYVGRYYQKGGRYVCVGAPPASQTVVSRFDLKQGVRSIFGEALAAAVSGFSVEVDTSASQGGGKSSAFIRRISFLP
jgi:hypothetical protein